MNEKCRSLKETVLRQEGKDPVTVYVRCESHERHPGKNHRSWIRKWTDSEEDGWIEDSDEGLGDDD